MKRIFQIILILSLSLFVFSCEDNSSPEQETIEIYGVEFAPNYFKKDGSIVGMDADIAQLALQDAGVKVSLHMSDNWEEIYNATLLGGNRALITAAYTPERANLFKWAGPTSKSFYSVLTKSASGYGYGNNIETAKSIESISVVKEWYETKLLEDIGFDNLVYFDTYQQALSAFMNDDVTGIATDFQLFRSSTPEDYYSSAGINISYRYKSVAYYLAFSKDVDDEIIEICQNAINEMIKDGITYQIGNYYINNLWYSAMPGTIEIYSEKAPPMNYVVRNEHNQYITSGSSGDIVQEIQKRIGDKNFVTNASWEDGYDVVQYLPNSALFTTARTAERENKFKWVGPIASLNAKFFTLADNNNVINSIEDAKQLGKIATPKGWYTYDYLLANSFDNVVSPSDDVEEIFNMLIDGEADALLIYDTAIKWLCEENDFDYTKIKSHISVQSDKGYIAFSKATADSIVNKWQNALNEMKNDGGFEAIWNRYYPGIPMP
jgi:polar amino acid transport system substrate-binding protein